jgi:hypothetical protein
VVGSLLIFAGACSGAPPSKQPPAVVAPAEAPVPAAPAVTGSAAPGSGGTLVGLCEASALLPWQGGWLVGDNEDKRALHGFGPDFTPLGAVPLPTEVDDIEALTAGPGGYWVIGSHSTNKDGEPRPARARILAPDGRLVPLALEACPRCEAARTTAPDAGGFNIEGAAFVDGALWLGLRGPLSESGAALLLAVDATGRVTRTVELPLGGHGVRDLLAVPGGLLVVGGPVADGTANHALWRIGAPGDAPERLAVELPASTEGISLDPTDSTRLVYVTDGDGKPGKPCKDASRWGALSLPAAPPDPGATPEDSP